MSFAYDENLPEFLQVDFETICYIVVYIPISLSYKDMYRNKCLYLFLKASSNNLIIKLKLNIENVLCLTQKIVNHF